MAAYEGNVDRYHRLRRPVMVESEQKAVIRGIYHSTSFAMYWTKCDLNLGRPIDGNLISLAITARRVMVNDLSDIDEWSDTCAYAGFAGEEETRTLRVGCEGDRSQGKTP
jgi:hypothetical protein